MYIVRVHVNIDRLEPHRISRAYPFLQCETPLVERQVGLIVLYERLGVCGVPHEQVLGQQTSVVKPLRLTLQQLTEQTI